MLFMKIQVLRHIKPSQLVHSSRCFGVFTASICRGQAVGIVGNHYQSTHVTPQKTLIFKRNISYWWTMML